MATIFVIIIKQYIIVQLFNTLFELLGMLKQNLKIILFLYITIKLNFLWV